MVQCAVSSSVADPDDALKLQIRANQKGSWQTWEHAVMSFKQQGPFSSSPKVYRLFMEPRVKVADETDGVISFDMMSFDAGDDTSSWLYLEDVGLYKISVTP